MECLALGHYIIEGQLDLAAHGMTPDDNPIAVETTLDEGYRCLKVVEVIQNVGHVSDTRMPEDRVTRKVRWKIQGPGKEVGRLNDNETVGSIVLCCGQIAVQGRKIVRRPCTMGKKDDW